MAKDRMARAAELAEEARERAEEAYEAAHAAVEDGLDSHTVTCSPNGASVRWP